jgi:hypothetical protein
MPRDYFDECKIAIEADLAEVLTASSFMSSAFKVYAAVGGMLPLVAPDQGLRSLLVEFRNCALSELTIVNQSLFVQAWSAFELFCRNLISAFLDELISKRSDFETIDKLGLAKKNLQHTGVALQHIVDNRLNLGIDFYSLARNASTSVPGSAKVVLNAAAFTIFMRGPSADGLKEGLSRIGMNLNWDDLGRNGEVQKAFKTRGTRETSKQVEEFLKSSARQRNNIVHRGVTMEAITESDLTNAIAVLRALATALVELVKDDCEKKATSH